MKRIDLYRDDMVGRQFDTHQGFVSWKAQPENLFAEITKLFQHTQKEQLITEECYLSGPKLTEKFFAKLDLDVNKEIEKYDNIKKLSKSERQKIKEQIEEKSPLRKMQDFKKIVDQIDAENIKIFGLPDFGDQHIIVDKQVYTCEQGPSIACYSVPKNSLVNEATLNTEPATAPTKLGRHR